MQFCLQLVKVILLKVLRYKAITQSGIKKVVYAELYDRSPENWADILKQAGIEVIQYSRNNLRSLNWEQIRNFCGE